MKVVTADFSGRGSAGSISTGTAAAATFSIPGVYSNFSCPAQNGAPPQQPPSQQQQQQKQQQQQQQQVLDYAEALSALRAKLPADLEASSYPVVVVFNVFDNAEQELKLQQQQPQSNEPDFFDELEVGAYRKYGLAGE